MARPNLRLRSAFSLASSLAQELAGGGPVQAVVQHERANAAGFGSDNLHAQHTEEISEDVFDAAGADDQVVFGGQPGQNGEQRRPPGLVGDGRFGAKLLRDQSAKTDFVDQFEAEPLRRGARHFLFAATRLSRDRDQRHDEAKPGTRPPIVRRPCS